MESKTMDTGERLYLYLYIHNQILIKIVVIELNSKLLAVENFSGKMIVSFHTKFQRKKKKDGKEAIYVACTNQPKIIGTCDTSSTYKAKGTYNTYTKESSIFYN